MRSPTMEILVQSEPIVDERVRVLIDEELKSFDVKQGDAIKKIEDLNEEFIKNHAQSLTHRAEGTVIRLFFGEFFRAFRSIFSGQSDASH